MALTKEQEQALLNRSSMIGAAQGPLTLGGAGNVPAYGDSRLTGGGASIPPFPSNFSNIGPETTSKPIPFAGGGTTSMGLGRASVNYSSRLGLAGGDYGTRFQFGADEFGGARLPQASGGLDATGLDYDRPMSFMDARANFNQKFPNSPMSPMEASSANLMSAGRQPQSKGLSFEEGPISMGFNTAQTATQQGKTEIKTPRGSMWATPEQEERAKQMVNGPTNMPRTPEQQQALIAQMRQIGKEAGARAVADREATIQQRRANPATYDKGITIPTDPFGRPIKEWADMFAKQGRIDVAPSQSVSTSSMLANNGFGAMQKAQSEMLPPAIRNQSIFGGMGYTSTLGGPQPASSMVAAGSINDQRRRRIFGTV